MARRGLLSTQFASIVRGGARARSLPFPLGFDGKRSVCSFRVRYECSLRSKKRQELAYNDVGLVLYNSKESNGVFIFNYQAPSGIAGQTVRQAVRGNWKQSSRLMSNPMPINQLALFSFHIRMNHSKSVHESEVPPSSCRRG